MSDRGAQGGFAPFGQALVGREREFALLWQGYVAVQAGRGRVALVAGEPGIGKTRLLDELAARAAALGATVLRGGASLAEGMPPYLPFLEALGGHLRAAPAERLRAQLGANAATLAAFLPEIAARLGDVPPGYPLPPEQARLRLFGAIGDWLAAIATPPDAAGTRPLALILDDLQWADAATLDLLGHLARQAIPRLLIAGAYRDGEVADNPALGRALAELNRLRALTTIAPARLETAATAALAAALLDAPLTASADDELQRQSEGNPFFAEEIVRDWREAGALVRAGDAWGLRPDAAARPQRTIAEAVRQRLARFDPAIVERLRTAALVGRSFDAALLAAVADQDEEATEEQLAVAARAGLLRDEGEGRYAFGHDKIRETLREELTTARRRRLHGRIGLALAERGDAAPDRLAALAFHFARSGERERGATASLRAAAAAAAAYGAEEALAHYRAALDLLDPADPRRGAALLGAGEAALLAGDLPAAVAAFAAARERFRAGGDDPAAGRAAHRLGQAHWRREALPEALDAFTEAHALLGDTPRPEAIAALVDLGSLLGVNLGRLDEGLDHARQALALAQALGDRRLEATATRAVGNLLVRGNELARGIALLRRALDLAGAADDPTEEAECCACLITAFSWSGEVGDFRAVALRQIAAAERSRDLYQQRHVHGWLAAYHANVGRWPEALRAIEVAQAIADRLDAPEPRAFVEHNRGSIALWHGDHAEAEASLRAAADTYRRLHPPALIWYLDSLAYAQAAQGKHDEAAATIAELEGIMASYPVESVILPGLCSSLGLIAALVGDRDRVARYYPLTQPFAGRFGLFIISRTLGVMATTLGDWTAAERHLADAERAARRLDLLPELARTLAARGALALARGGPAAGEEASRFLADALAIFDAIGWATEGAQLRDRLAALAPRRPAALARPALPAGLSAREAEVLRLVATGKTNREIAAALFISEKTVANHLTAIFTKIGADNRVGATAFAIRQGLAGETSPPR